MKNSSDGKTKSLVVRFSLSIAILVFAVCSALTVTALFFFNDIQEQQVTKAMTTAGKDAGKIVDMQMKMLQNQVEAIAKRSEMMNADTETQINLLNEELISDEYFLRFEVSDSSGNFISTDNDTFWDGGSSWFSASVTGKTAISDVQFDQYANRMVIVISAPIFDDDGNIKGVLAGVVSSGILNQITKEVDLQYDGRCFIINPAGAKMSGVEYPDGQETLVNDLYNTEAVPGGSLEQLALVEKRMI